jgi:uncharacterized membrane protein YdfJ with MMPL/SSD domain
LLSILAKLANARARLVLIVATIALVVGGGFAGTVQPLLSTGLSDYDVPNSSGVQAREDVQRATGIDYQQGYVLLVRGEQQLDPAAAPPPLVARTIQLLKDRPEVKNVIDYHSAQAPTLISRDGRSTYVIGEVGEIDERKAAESLQEAVADDPELADRVVVGGATVGNVQISDISTQDLGMAEAVAFPILLLLLFLFFRGLVAALLPLLGGMVTITFALLGMRLTVPFVDLSVFSLNVLFALGLGLSIDFSLLMLSRYREELARVGDVAQAVTSTVRTTGRTVLFSGLTVGVALLTLTLFPQRFLYSMGVAGVFVTIFAVIFAIVLLPAVFRVLGHRVNALAPARLRYVERENLRTGWWYRLATAVMRGRWLAVLGATAVLLLAGLPFLGIKYTGVDSSVVPTSVSSGEVARAIENDFEGHAATPVRLAVYAPASAQADVAAYAQRVQAVEGIKGVLPPRNLSDSLWEVDAFLAYNQISTEAQQTVERLERVEAPFDVKMFGLAAEFVQRQDDLANRLPLAGALIVLATLILLFAFTGSVVLPIQMLLMNVLTISASLGLLVFIFQDGRLTDLLDYTSQSAVESTTPIILICLVFGRSTDYGVFLLGRIKEARDRGASNTREAAAIGLEHTGRIVTSAAGLFCVAVGALVLSRLVSIKELGLGTAFGVLVDATIVRAILVPSLMALFGEFSWWAPGFLRALHRRLRLDRIESSEPIAPTEPAPATPGHR